MKATSQTTSPSFATAAAVSRMAEALADRRAVVLPVEGTFVLAAAAAGGAGAAGVATVARAAGIVDPVGSPGEFWLAPDAAVLERALGESAAGVHRRLIRRLAPGPAVFVHGDDRAGFAPELEGSPRRFTGAMCTGESFALSVLARVAFSVVAAEIFGPDQRPAQDLDAVMAALSALGVQAERPVGVAGAGGAGDGPAAAAGMGTRLASRLPATVIELLAPAAAARAGVAFRVRRAGGYEERFIRKQLAMTVLFVCTGNTCRSPMAEAIATALVNRVGEESGAGGGGGGGMEVRFASAGTAASSSSQASEEAARALRELKIGAGLSGHRSRALSRRMIEEADAIYTMGRSHLHAVLEMAPDAEGRVQTLDPDGGDVPDPIGMSQDVYTTTARRIMEMVRRRLKELGT